MVCLGSYMRVCRSRGVVAGNAFLRRGLRLEREGAEVWERGGWMDAVSMRTIVTVKNRSNVNHVHTRFARHFNDEALAGIRRGLPLGTKKTRIDFNTKLCFRPSRLFNIEVRLLCWVPLRMSKRGSVPRSIRCCARIFRVFLSFAGPRWNNLRFGGGARS